MSSIPQNKQELHRAVKSAFEKILVDYSSIPKSLTRKIAIEGNIKGSEISVCDTLAYLIGWGKLVLKWHRLRSAGNKVEFPETDYKWNQLGELAQSFHEYYCESTYGDLLLEFNLVTREVLLLIDSLNNHELYAEKWYEKYSLGRMIQFNTSSPMKNMRTKIRRFKKANGLN